MFKLNNSNVRQKINFKKSTKFNNFKNSWQIGLIGVFLLLVSFISLTGCNKEELSNIRNTNTTLKNTSFNINENNVGEYHNMFLDFYANNINQADINKIRNFANTRNAEFLNSNHISLTENELTLINEYI